MDKALEKVLTAVFAPLIAVLTEISNKLGAPPQPASSPAAIAAPAPLTVAALAPAASAAPAAAPVAAAPAVSRQVLGQGLLAIAKIDPEKATELILKFGANKEEPRLGDIPVANYGPLALAIQETIAAYAALEKLQ